jgi:thiamine biosynthesis lipoprotein
MPTLHVIAEQNHMATTFRFTIACPSTDVARAERLLKSCQALVARLEDELTEFRATSPIHVLNHAPLETWIELGAHGSRLLQRALDLSTLTQGAFDPTAKSSSIALTLALNERIELDLSNQRARRFHAGVHLGFGAIGKGYALDQVRLELEREGFQDFCLSAGGSSTVLSGQSAPSEDWRFGWTWTAPKGADSFGLSLSHGAQKPISLGVSGTHEKGFHLVNPRSGKAVREGAPLSVLVGHPQAADADALSTALFVGGWDQAIENLKSQPQEIALAQIDARGAPRWNGIFQKYWGALAMLALWLTPLSQAEEAIDLAADGSLDHFNPYVFDRDATWLILPAFGVFYVLIHLFQYKNRPKRPPSEMPRKETP